MSERFDFFRPVSRLVASLGSVALLVFSVSPALAAAGDGEHGENDPGSRPAVLVGASVVAASEINEASGLALSRTEPGVLWVVNDSGGEPRVFAIGADARLLCSYDLPGAASEDYEDLALGRGPEAGADYLYIADIGDNLSRRDSVVVYRVPEPRVSDTCAGSTPGSAAFRGSLEPGSVHAISMTYPDGPRDAQTLLGDPVTGDLFVVTRTPAGPSEVFRAPYDRLASGSVKLEKVASVALAGTGVSEVAVTGGDVSPDGRRIVLRTYNGAWMWQRDGAESIAQALTRSPVSLPVVGPPQEPQGESIALGEASYFTLGEGIAQSLYRFDFAR